MPWIGGGGAIQASSFPAEMSWPGLPLLQPNSFPQETNWVGREAWLPLPMSWADREPEHASLRKEKHLVAIQWSETMLATAQSL